MSINPLTLRGAGLSYGLTPQLPPELQPRRKQEEAAAPPGMDPRARNAGLAAALSNTPRVEGNSWVEALAAALTGGLRGRTEMDQRQQELADHQREIDQQTRTQKVEDGRQASIADALTAYQSADPNDPLAQRNALVGALSRGDPQDALPMVSADITRRTPEQPEWQAGYGRAYRINPDGSTDLGGAIPEAPRAASTTFSFGAGTGADGTGGDLGMDSLARQIAHGTPITSIRGLPRGAMPALNGRAVEMLMEENPGMTREQAENRIVSNRANYAATTSTLRNMTLGNEQVQRAFQELEAFNQISQEQLALLRNGDNTVINQIRNRAGQIFGDPNITGANNALSTQLRMFARIASGGTGSAAQTHVAALEQAADILDTNASPAQIARAMEIMAREAPIVRDAYQHRLEILTHRLETGDYSYNGEEPAAPQTMGGLLSRSIRQGLNGGGQAPAGIPQAEWDNMPPEDRARVQQIMGGQ